MLIGPRFFAGVWRNFDIPSLSTSSKNFVQLLPELTGTQPIFVSFRSTAGYDFQMTKGFVNKVMRAWHPFPVPRA
jgi:hypothetical protein